MINKALFGLAFVAIGALGYGWWYNNSLILAAQNERIRAFMAAGARFTAQDGQRLCERIADHERYHGLPSRPCEFGK